MDILKVIKRINERLNSYEKRDLTNSSFYNKIIDSIKMSGLEITHSKNGNIRISRSKKAIEKIESNKNNIEALERIDKKPSLSQEVSNIRKKFKDADIRSTMSDVYDVIREKGKLEKWLEDNLQAVYDDARSGLVEAFKIEDSASEGLRRLSYGGIWKMIADYEKAVSERDKIFSKSNFNKKGIFK